MLLGDKEKTIRLFAENFLWGNLTFDYGEMDDERVGLVRLMNKIADELRAWTYADSKNPPPEDHKAKTHSIYHKLFGLRIKGRLNGVLVDVDLENENTRLKDENMRFKLQNEELKKDNLILARELKDKTDLLDEYEKTTGVRKP